jgi:hypothetical protein
MGPMAEKAIEAVEVFDIGISGMSTCRHVSGGVRALNARKRDHSVRLLKRSSSACSPERPGVAQVHLKCWTRGTKFSNCGLWSFQRKS